MTTFADTKASREPQRTDELTTLLAVSQTMVGSFDIDRNLRKSMRLLAEGLGLTRSMVALVNPDTRELRIAAAHGLTRAEIARGIYRAGEGVVGRVVASGKAMVVPNVGEEPLFLNRTASRTPKADIGFIAVPITLRGEVLGALTADRVFEDETVSLDEDVRVLEIVASIIAHAVRLYWTYQHEVESRESLRRELRGRYSMPNIIGDSDAMQEVFRVVTKVARSSATVLLRGETGTGKELIAHALHYQRPRREGPVRRDQLRGPSRDLLESELFGYEKGAFTGAVASKPGRFELADGGTLFLDEIGDISPAAAGQAAARPAGAHVRAPRRDEDPCTSDVRDRRRDQPRPRSR